ncbi:MAG: alpha/beta hydrolase family protein, partial [Petrimonas sp.]
MFYVENVFGQSFYEFYKKNSTNNKWNEIKPYFTPPDEFKNQYGDYRSPLLFYNGNSVKTKQDWQKRRTEIRNRWMSLMGNWPPIIKDQQFEILETEKREDFTQHRVRFFWTPNQQTEGYLLIPDEKGKKPAVISVFYEPETAAGIGGKPYRDFAYQLTKRGFVTLSLGTTETTRYCPQKCVKRIFSIFDFKQTINNLKLKIMHFTQPQVSKILED